MSDKVLESANAIIKEIRESRNKKMMELREEGLTLVEIGKRFGVSRQRVQQIIGNTGYMAAQKKMEYVQSSTDKTNRELSEEMGLSISRVSTMRNGTRHKVEGGYVATGKEWEDWASEYLSKNGIRNELQGNKAPYDIIALGNVFIDVKSTATTVKTTPRMKSPQYHFRTNNRHNLADVYMLIIAPLEDVFIVPAELIQDRLDIYFCWPTKRPEIGKLQKYHNRIDVIWNVYYSKTSKELANQGGGL